MVPDATVPLRRVASEEKRKPEQSRPSVYEWENKLAVVGYTGSPYPNPLWDLEKGSPEARAGTFVLTEVSSLGIMASRVLREQDEEGVRFKLDDPLFIPWSSVHSIRLLEPHDKSSDSDEG